MALLHTSHTVHNGVRRGVRRGVRHGVALTCLLEVVGGAELARGAVVWFARWWCKLGRIGVFYHALERCIAVSFGLGLASPGWARIALAWHACSGDSVTWHGGHHTMCMQSTGTRILHSVHCGHKTTPCKACTVPTLLSAWSACPYESLLTLEAQASCTGVMHAKHESTWMQGYLFARVAICFGIARVLNAAAFVDFYAAMHAAGRDHVYEVFVLQHRRAAPGVVEGSDARPAGLAARAGLELQNAGHKDGAVVRMCTCTQGSRVRCDTHVARTRNVNQKKNNHPVCVWLTTVQLLSCAWHWHCQRACLHVWRSTGCHCMAQRV